MHMRGSETLSWLRMQQCRGGEGWGFTAYETETRACDGEDGGEGRPPKQHRRGLGNKAQQDLDRESGALRLTRCRVDHSRHHRPSRGTVTTRTEPDHGPASGSGRGEGPDRVPPSPTSTGTAQLPS
eukprot:3362159-Rhodomonas_salina.4